jgi:Zn-dependent peptidase ImmA (M78 family)/transcriptional regulator with XRE-family HTH domain
MMFSAGGPTNSLEITNWDGLLAKIESPDTMVSMGNAEIGRRIRELREEAAVQSQQLAEAIGVGPSAMSLIESGERALKASELAVVADYLGVSPVAILDPNSILARLPVSARSSTNSIPVLRTKLLRLAELHDVLHSGGVASESVPTPPQPSAQDWLENSRRLADWARMKLGAGQSTWTFESLADRITASLGIDIMVESIPEIEENGASITDPEFPLIFVNASQARSRALFTLAHELGHVLMQDGVKLFVEQSLGGDERERFVNAFAAELLMPETSIRKDMRELQMSAMTIATMLIRYQVSFESFVYRLHNLQFIRATQRDELNKRRLSGLLARVDDPQVKAQVMSLAGDLDAPRAPMLLVGRLIKGYLSGVVSARPIAGLLGKSVDEVVALIQPSMDDPEDEFDTEESSAHQFSGQPV